MKFFVKPTPNESVFGLIYYILQLLIIPGILVVVGMMLSASPSETIINVLFFAFYFISVPLMQNRAAVLGQGENSNLVMGAFNATKSFGQIFGSALAGFLYEWTPKMPFVFGFAAFALATAMAAMMVRTEK